MENVTIPTLYPIKQELPKGEPADIERTLEAEFARLDLAAQVRGKRIALGFGSRGIAQIDRIAAALVALVKEAGGMPFIVPAMGSHGGATPAGQIEVLDGLGISEATMGCPINATMEVVNTGATSTGLPAYLDKNVFEADGLIITNRVKVHTDFRGPHESGLLKMLAVGLGKETGARTIHQQGVVGLRDYMPVIAQHLLGPSKFVAGFGVVEDGYHEVAQLEGFSADTVVEGDQRLLRISRELMPRLPVDDIDVLIIDEMGKNISGAGMDTNIIGRWMVEGEPEPESPRIKRIAILDLTPESHGNATTYGLADFMSRKLFDKIDFPITMKNMFTSGFLLRCRMPLVFESDEETIKATLFDAFRADPSQAADARVVRIKNTLALENVWVSANIAAELNGSASIEVGEGAAELAFAGGMLV
ncbi:MAG: lactate racemase domain-containing protein [Chloroflexi bacterium]|nr:lactate racemase domain-containing protein [Chloroflexota bacterium]